MKTNHGTLIIRLPNELKHRVELIADEQGVSLNQFALYAFTKEVVQSEVSGFFVEKWKGKSKKEIFSNFDNILKKVKKSNPQIGINYNLSSITLLSFIILA